MVTSINTLQIPLNINRVVRDASTQTNEKGSLQQLFLEPEVNDLCERDAAYYYFLNIFALRESGWLLRRGETCVSTETCTGVSHRSDLLGFGGSCRARQKRRFLSGARVPFTLPFLTFALAFRRCFVFGRRAAGRSRTLRERKKNGMGNAALAKSGDWTSWVIYDACRFWGLSKIFRTVKARGIFMSFCE